MFTVTHNRYVNMKKEDVDRNQFWPNLSQQVYDELGEINAKQLLDLYAEHRQEPLDTIVDYGCGDARVLKVMEKHCKNAIGLDISDLVLEAARPNTTATLVNIEKFKDEDCADFIYSLQVLQHNTYQDQLKILGHIKRTLKPTGLACIHFPKIEDKPWYQNHMTCMCYTIEQVKAFGELFSNTIIVEVEIAPKWFDYYMLGGK